MNREWNSRFRRRLSLNGVWRFLPCGKAGAWIDTPEKADMEVWARINVPAFYRGDGFMRYAGKSLHDFGYSGELSKPSFPRLEKYCWYKRSFRLSRDRGKAYVLFFGGVSAVAEVWVNDSFAGRHEGAYTPFKMDVTELLRDGVNRLFVKVTGLDAFRPISKYDGVQGRHCETIAPGESLASGIYLDVGLDIVPKTHIAEAFLTTTLDSVTLKTELAGETTGDLSIRVVIKDIEGKTVAEKTSLYAETLTLEGIKARSWSPRFPVLYRAEIYLLKDENLIDLYVERIGFRTFEVSGNRFRLNGSPYFLRGGNCPPHGLVRRDRKYIDKFVSLIKKGGMNFMCFHALPGSAHWLDACDERGVLVSQESPAMQTVMPLEVLKREMRELVRGDMNHPSLVIWSLGGECSFPACSGHLPSFREYVVSVERFVKAIDPSRPTINDNHESAARVGGDIDTLHSYDGWYFLTRKAIKRRDPAERVDRWIRFAGKPELFSDIRSSYQLSADSAPAIFDEYLAAYSSNRNVFFQRDIRLRRIGDPPERLLPAACEEFARGLVAYVTERTRLLRGPCSNISGIAPFALMNWFHNLGDARALVPKKIFETIAAVLAPVTLVCDVQDRNFRSGQRVSIPCAIINDAESGEEIRVSQIELIVVENGAERTLARHKPEDGVVCYDSSKSWEISATLPTTGKPVEERAIYCRCVYYEGARRRRLKSARKKINLCGLPKSARYPTLRLLGRDARLEAFFEKLAIKTRRIDTILDFRDKELPLIVAPGASRDLVENVDAFAEAIAAGPNRRIVVMEQQLRDWPDAAERSIDLSRLAGSPLCLAREISYNNLNIYDYDDFVWFDAACPLFKDLTPEILRDPNGDGILISCYFKQCDGTNRNMDINGKPEYRIERSPGIRELATAYDGLNRAAVVEIARGEGTCLWSQIEIARRLNDDPVAEIYARNIIRYLRER